MIFRRIALSAEQIEFVVKRLRDRTLFKEDSGCKLYAPELKSDYPLIKVGGEDYLFHRLAYEIWNGPISDGMQVLHHCDNPKCYTPEHLFLGTQRDNIADMVRKDRQHRGPKGPYCRDQFGKKNPMFGREGEKAPGVKLTEKDIREIHHLHSQGLTHATIAKKFSVSGTQVSAIVRGKKWKFLYKELYPIPLAQEILPRENDQLLR